MTTYFSVGPAFESLTAHHAPRPEHSRAAPLVFSGADDLDSERARGNLLHLDKEAPMPLYLDVHHRIEGLTGQAVGDAHQKDLQVQHKHNVKYLRYWYDEGTGKVFCLVEAPSKEAAAAVHREAHGLVADEIIEVKEGS
jgi:hypothetical protein